MPTTFCGLPRILEASNPATVDAAIALRKSGWRNASIAAALGVSERHVRRWFQGIAIAQDRKSTERE